MAVFVPVPSSTTFTLEALRSTPTSGGIERRKKLGSISPIQPLLQCGIRGRRTRLTKQNLLKFSDLRQFFTKYFKCWQSEPLTRKRFVVPEPVAADHLSRAYDQARLPTRSARLIGGIH